MKELFQRRVLDPVIALLRQGLTPEGIALALAMGVVAGIFPVIGATTILGLALGLILQLNQPALHLANWLAYPLQLALIVPLVRLGEWLAGAPPMSLSIAGAVSTATTDPALFLTRFGLTGLHGILGWLAVAPLVALVLYRVLLPLLRGVGPGASPDAPQAKPGLPADPRRIISETP